MKKLFFAGLLTAAFALFADEYSDMAAYEPGKSLSWFHSLSQKAQSEDSGAEVASKILDEISKNRGLSPEAFRLACAILKPIADSDCVEVLAPYLYDELRAPSVCDVFLGIDSSSVDEALIKVLGDSSAKRQLRENAAALLAARGTGKKQMIEAANSADKDLALFAVGALARYSDDTGLFSIFDTSVVSALGKIAGMYDYRSKAAVESLCLIAQKAAVNDEEALARKALEFVPLDCPNAVYARSVLMDGEERVKYLDSLIIQGGNLTAAAAKAMNQGRTFENSLELIKRFPNLNKKAKLAAMGSFMIANDTAFYQAIAPELDNPDSDIRGLAVYSARFLCTDDANMLKIYNIYKKNEEPISRYAYNVLLENPSYAVQRVLKDKADSGDMDAFEILVLRGDESYRMKLWNMFFDEATRTPAICKMLENTITSGQINLLATNYKLDDPELSKEITKIIVRKMMHYKKSPSYMAMAVKTALDGNLKPDDPNYKFIVEKLRIKDKM